MVDTETILKENFCLCLKNHIRSIILLIGPRSKKNIPYFHYIWSKNSSITNSGILWCSQKKNACLNNFERKKNKKKKNQETTNLGFFNLSKILYCYYEDMKKILGNTFGICVLENFEAISPNVLVKAIETVEGGGLIFFIIDTLNDIDSLFSLSMEIHKKYKTEMYSHIVGRFLERFLYSLKSCPTLLIFDDDCNVIWFNWIKAKKFRVFSEIQNIKLNEKKELFVELIKNTKNLEPLSSLIEKTRTFDQARAFLTLTEAISDKQLFTTVVLTAPRGRGKSAAIGLAISAAIAYGYGNIYITAPDPENLNTFFAFLLIGLKTLNYEENKHFDITYDSRMKFIKSVNIHSTHKQKVTFFFPSQIEPIKNEIELLIIDEAAGIPSYRLDRMFGNYVIFMSSTTSGYEGTGRNFNLKFLKNIRLKNLENSNTNFKKFLVKEITINEPIRYSNYDPVEKWLNDFLCLNNKVPDTLINGCPNLDSCKLFLVDRNMLFSEHKTANSFLQKIVNILASVHYKNSPDDLQMICDAPSHRILVLINHLPLSVGILPDIISVLHIAYEGQISKKFIERNIFKNLKVNGDLIPWVVSREFFDSYFAEFSGIRIIRIAVHPDIHSMGYGSKTVEFLRNFFEKNKFLKLQETSFLRNLKNIKEKINSINPILINLDERFPPELDYIGVSFGLTYSLFNFWKKNEFRIIFIKNKKNILSEEYTCIMINSLSKKSSLSTIIKSYQFQFINTFIDQLNWKLIEIPIYLVYDIIQNAIFCKLRKEYEKKKIKEIVNFLDVQKIFLLIENSSYDYKIIIEVFSILARLLIWNKFMRDNFLTLEILLIFSIGLQHRSLETLQNELSIKVEDVCSLTTEILKKFMVYLN